ncbi:hypothetical protein [Ruminococcus sp. AM42-11]|uniref:hypothetical protein n=1 Tax=Ruminococcus sp. AM42-11 TaxID=2292372 RepID=UPI002689217C
MSTTSNSVPAGKENSILTVLVSQKLLSILAWVRTEFMNCLTPGSLKDSAWDPPGRLAEWLWRIIS